MQSKVKLNLHIVESNLFKSSACFGTHLLAKASRKETMLVITFTVLKDNKDQTDYTISGTLKEINDKVQSLSNDNVYLEPNNLQWKGISARINNDLAETIQIIEQMPDFSTV